MSKDAELNKFRVTRINELTEELITKISYAISEISDKNEFLKHFYEELNWETEVSYIIEEGLTKLGIGLATLEIHKREPSIEEEKAKLCEE